MLNLGNLATLRNVMTALSWLPAEIGETAAQLIPRIIVLPETQTRRTDFQLCGASFELSRTVLIFEDPGGSDEEEQLTTLHEILHILDPGWHHKMLRESLRAEMPTVPAQVRQRLQSVGSDPFEQHAELGSWDLAGVAERRYLPKSREIIRAALHGGF